MTYHVDSSGTKSSLQPTVEEQTKDRTTVVSSTNGTLPLCRNMLCAILIRPSKLFQIRRMSEEVVDETNIHTLHDQGHTQKHTECDGRPVS